MKTLTSKSVQYLKRQAHHLEPVVWIGKNGVSDEIIRKTDASLLDHELIKIKFVDHKGEKKELIGQIIQQTGAHLVSLIGHIGTLYRAHPETEKQKIHLPN